MGNEVVECGQAQGDQLGIDVGRGDAGDRKTSSGVDLDDLTRVDDLVGLIREEVYEKPAMRGCQHDSLPNRGGSRGKHVQINSRETSVRMNSNKAGSWIPHFVNEAGWILSSNASGGRGE